MFEKSYLIKAFYQWASDYNHTIEILLWFKHPSVNNNVPHQYLNIDEEEGLLFNISRGSVHLEIGKDAIEFSFYLRGEDYKISADIDSIYWIRAKEVGEYLRLDGDDKPYIKGVFTNIREEEKIKEEIKNKRVGMAPEDIEKWVRENKDKYTNMLHINDWHITYKIIKQDDAVSIKNEGLHYNEGGRSGDCNTLYQYKSATIRLFAAQIHSIESLKRILIHELAHVAMACFNLYTKFFEERNIHFDSEKEIARKIKKDVHELLAIKIEAIIADKENDFIGIYEKASEADERFRIDCQEASILDKPRIVMDNKIVHADSFQIVEEAKKHDASYWYGQYQKARDLNYEKSQNKPNEKKREESFNNYNLEIDQKNKNIIFSPDHKDAVCDGIYPWKEIIIPIVINGRKEEGNVNNFNNAGQ